MIEEEAHCSFSWITQGFTNLYYIKNLVANRLIVKTKSYGKLLRPRSTNLH